MTKKSKPWKVVFLTAGGPLPDKPFTSEKAVYQAVNHERERVCEGISRVGQAVVYQWDKSADRWMTFERHDLRKEAEELRKAREVAEAKRLAEGGEGLPWEPDDWAIGEGGKPVDLRGEK